MKGRIGSGTHAISAHSVILAGRLAALEVRKKGNPKEWSKDEMDAARDGYKRGLSFGQIAKALKKGRGAVAGKLHRMGLLKGRAVPSLKEVPAAQNKGLGALGLAHVAQKIAHPSPYAAVKYHCDPIEGSTPVDIENVQLRHCRWVVTENGADKFCGLDKAKTGSFCEQHHKFAYVKEPPRPHRATNKDNRNGNSG